MDEPQASTKSSKNEVEEWELVEDMRPSYQVENDDRSDTTNRGVISGGSIHSSNVAKTVYGGMNNTVTNNNVNIYCSGVCIEHPFPGESGITYYEVDMRSNKRDKKQTPSTIRQVTADEIQKETKITSTAIQEESAVAANHSSTEMVVNPWPAAFIDDDEVDGFVSVRLRDNVKVIKSSPVKAEAADSHKILRNEDPNLCGRAEGGTSISDNSNQSLIVGDRSLLTEDTDDIVCSPGTTKRLAKSEEYSLQHETNNSCKFFGRPRKKSFTDFGAFWDGLHDLPYTVHSQTEENVIYIVKLASKCSNSKLKEISTFIRQVRSSANDRHSVNIHPEQNSTGTRKCFIDFQTVLNELDSLSDEVRTITDQIMVRLLEIANADPCKLQEVSNYLENILLEEVSHTCVIT